MYLTKEINMNFEHFKIAIKNTNWVPVKNKSGIII
jgi:hypothetical protein